MRRAHVERLHPQPGERRAPRRIPPGPFHRGLDALPGHFRKILPHDGVHQHEHPVTRAVFQPALDEIGRVADQILPDSSLVSFEYDRSSDPVTRMSGFLWILAVLELIETLLVANLLQIMIVGGYRVYVQNIRLPEGSESPSWVRHASVTNLKLKLALGVVGVSSVNLLESFINANNYSDRVLWAQAGLHGVFLVSALVIALIDWARKGPTGARVSGVLVELGEGSFSGFEQRPNG